MRWPISAKGILGRDGHVLVMKNDRDEWELPGGHVEPKESPEDAVIREFFEETGLTCAIAGMISADFYQPLEDESVCLLFYAVRESEPKRSIRISEEHQGVLWAPVHQLPGNLPGVYQHAIRMAWNRTDLEGLYRHGDMAQRLRRLTTTSTVEPVIGIE